MIIYIVIQHQPDDPDYDGRPVNAYYERKEADKECKKCNKEYGYGDEHYYEVQESHLL